MAAAPERHLRPVPDEKPDRRLVVDPDTGESQPLAEVLRAMQDQIDGLETDVRAWRTRHANLKRDKGAEAREHAKFPEAKKLFDYWREKTRHLKTAWTPERFFLCLPYLERDGIETCKLAVDGIAWKPYQKEVAPGYVERYDDFETLFKKRSSFDRMANRGYVWRKQQGLIPEKPPEEPPAQTELTGV